MKTLLPAICLLSGAFISGAAVAHEVEPPAAAIKCPDDIAGMILVERPDKVDCRYIRGTADLSLFSLAAFKPSLDEYAETMTETLDLRVSDKASALCVDAMTEGQLAAQCIVAYDSHVLGVVSEIEHDGRRLQARLFMLERTGINEQYLYWAIEASRALFEQVTAE